MNRRRFARTAAGGASSALAPASGQRPAARQRGMRTFCRVIEDNTRPPVANIEKLWERDLCGRLGGNHPAGPCSNNPNYRNFPLGLCEDYARSYDIDGIMWGSERQGALGSALGEFVRDSRSAKRPTDGYYVTFWRLLLRYPEILAWEMFWTDSLRETYRSIYGRVKSVNPRLQVGWHIWHNNSFHPLYRAVRNYRELSQCSDFLKPVLYNNCAGGRMASYIDSVGASVYGDFPKQQLPEFEYRVMNYQEAGYDRIPLTGFSSDYVYRETKRAVDGAGGATTRIWPGIDIDVPTAPGQSKCTPDTVGEAVLAAFRAGAGGVLLSRNYTEMRPENLSGAGQAVREMKLV